MKISKTRKETSLAVEQAKKKGKKVGFVPTMGALHDGHLSLVERSMKENSFTAVSIFVNPTQFNNPEDLKKYPRTLEEDSRQLKQAGIDLLFAPEVEEMYPNG